MPLSNASRLADFGTGIGTAGAIIQVDNANQRLGIGTTAPTATLGVAGIVSATAFYGDGSNLDGVASAGLGTALSEEEFNPLTVIYQTSDTLSVGATITVDPPDATTKVAYTQYAEIKLEGDADLIVADGDDFIPDILGLSTEGFSFSNANGNGIFDTVYTDNIENAAGRGAPNFPLGITVSGISTLSGNVSIGGTLTYEDVTNVDSIGVVTARNGIKVTTGGIDVTGDSSIAGNLTLPTTDAKLNLKDGNNYLQFLDTDKTFKFNNSWGAGEFTFHVNGGERLRIGSAGQIGVGGANYGTSGQVLTSQGGSAAPQWATPAGGGLTEIDSWGLYIGNWAGAGGGGWSNARWGNGASGDGTAVLTRQTDGTAQTPDNMPVGTGVTHTNGLFTFPSAGTWEMTVCLRLQHKQSQVCEFRAAIVPTVDGTTYVPSSSNVTLDENNAGYLNQAPMSLQAVFNFTNTATTNAYVRLNASNEAYINYKSNIIFKKLA